MAADKMRLKTLAIVLRPFFSVIGNRLWIGRGLSYIGVRLNATLCMVTPGLERLRHVVQVGS